MTSYLMWCIHSESFTFVSSAVMIHEQSALLGYDMDPGFCGDAIVNSSSPATKTAGESPQPGSTRVSPTNKAC